MKNRQEITITLRNIADKGFRGYEIINSRRHVKGMRDLILRKEYLFPAFIKEVGDLFVLRERISYNGCQTNSSQIIATVKAIDWLGKKMYSCAKNIANSYRKEDSRLVDKATEIENINRLKEIVSVNIYPEQKTL